MRERLRGFAKRFKVPLVFAGGALLAGVLMYALLVSRDKPREIAQEDIDAAVLHTLENKTLPSRAAKGGGIGPRSGRSRARLLRRSERP